jgi:hypothetical protein
MFSNIIFKDDLSNTNINIFMEIFCSRCTPSGRSGSDDTSLKTLWCSRTESIAGQTNRHFEYYNIDTNITYAKYRIDREKKSSAFGDSVSIIIKYGRPDIINKYIKYKKWKILFIYQYNTFTQRKLYRWVVPERRIFPKEHICWSLRIN